ncbi:MAG: hypothetical protein ACO1O1_15500 [Adhaeribacter sp.]
MQKKILVFAFLACLVAWTWMVFPVSGFNGYDLFFWRRNAERPAEVKNKTRIPLYPERWYQLNNTATGLQVLFDGKVDKNVDTGKGKVLHRFEAYYPLQEGEQMTIERILFYDGNGSNEEQPFTLSAITPDWKRVQLASFTGQEYNRWVGPAGNSREFKLPKPMVNPRYLVISTPSFYPMEMELYGTYKGGKAVAVPAPSVLARQKKVAFKHTTGVNAYEWDFEDAANPSVIDEWKWQAIRPFSGIRHYMDWEKLEGKQGQYTFNPVHAGGWNYDLIYQRCQAAGIEVLACLKTLPQWMIDTYPPEERDRENVPVTFGKDFAEPASYLEQARVAFQFAARYGRNKQVNPALLKVNAQPRWSGDGVNQAKAGLGLIRYMENENERDKWWKGRKAYQTGREYAANLSAFYDGHKNTLGPGAGVKNADPSMQVVMGGLAHPATDYVQGMIDWCREFRGYKADGSVNLCWDVINYHHYANDSQASQGGQPTRGVAPEVSDAARVAKDFLRFAHQQARGMPVWITETGYDLHPGSPFRAMAIGRKSPALTQADWILRASLLYARWGVEKVFFYQLADDKADDPGQFATSGLINQDRSLRPAADYLYQARNLLGEYVYQQTLQQDPLVDRYAWKDKTIYAVVVPDEKGREAPVSLELGSPYAYIYRPQAGKSHMSRELKPTTQGRLTLTATETPLFVAPTNSKR